MSTAPLILPNRTRTLVQVSSDWPSDPGGWTTIDAWCQSARVGMCNDVGSAELFTPAGNIIKPGNTLAQQIVSSDFTGAYVQVCQAAIGGSVVDPDDGADFDPMWWGIINDRNIGPDSESHAFFSRYSCAGLLAVLDSVTPKWHFGASPGLGGDSTANIGSAPIMNKCGSKLSPNMSLASYEFGPGVSAHVFDFSGTSGGAILWTAEDAVNYWLALFYFFSGGKGPIFTLAGATDALQYCEQWDLSGHSCGEAVSRIMSQKQGVGYRLEMDGTDPSIYVESMSPDPIVIPPWPSTGTPILPGFTVPANAEQVTVDLTSDSAIQVFSIQQSQASQADEVAVQMAPTWYMVTASLWEHFTPDWTTQDAQDYDNGKDPEDSSGALNLHTGMARAYRRFKINDATFTGQFYGGFNMPTDPGVASGDVFGVNGNDGTTTFNPEATQYGSQMEMTGDLPIVDGYDWASVSSATVDHTRKNAKAFAVVKSGTTDDGWETLAVFCGVERLEIEVDTDLAAITFSSQAQQTIEDMMDTGGQKLPIYITLGVRSQIQTTVSYSADTPDWARSQKRVFTKQRPHLCKKAVPIGTITGVNPNGTLQTVSSLTPGIVDMDGTKCILIQDDTGLALNILAMSIPWATKPAWNIGYSKRGEIDPTYAKPCQMLTEVSVLGGIVSPVDVLGIVSSVEYEFEEPGATKVTTKRIPVSVEQVT